MSDLLMSRGKHYAPERRAVVAMASELSTRDQDVK